VSDPQPQQACIDVSVRAMPEPSILVAMPRWAAQVMPMTPPVYYEDAPVARPPAVSTQHTRDVEAVHPPGPPPGPGDQAARLRAMMGGPMSGTAKPPATRDASPWPRQPDGPDDGADVQLASASTCAPIIAPPATPPKRAGSVIAIASGKGGVGKTSIAVNLGIALSRAGHRTALLDADIGTANADLLCGVTPRARLDAVLAAPPTECSERDLPEATPLRHPRRLADIAVEAPHGLRLVPGASGLSRLSDLSEVQRARLLEALNDADDLADLLLVDLGAGIGSNVTALAGTADLCLVVATPDPTSMADAYALIKTLHHASSSPMHRLGSPHGALPMLGLIVNQARDEREAREVARRLGSVCERFLCLPIPMYGWLAHDHRVAQSVRDRRPWFVNDPHSAPSRSIAAMTEVLVRRLGLHTGPCTTIGRGSSISTTELGRGASGIRSWLWRAFVRASRSDLPRR
jgi:flagellar biosynthesis protein FlhG